MKTVVAASVLLAMTIPTVMTPHKAVADQNHTNNCQSIVGSYLATATSPNNPNDRYRELINFNKDGNFTATDSNAGGDPDATKFPDQSFGPVQGSWKCTGNNEIIAKGLNFNYKSRRGLPASLSITIYKLKFNSQNKTITGSLSYDVYDVNSNLQNPTRIPNYGGPFKYNFAGNRITPH